MSEHLSYNMPKLGLLDNQHEMAIEESHRKKRILHKVFEENNVSIENNIVVISGLTFSIFKVIPSSGIKVSIIRNLSDDISLALGVSVRILQGDDYVGIEIPNDKRSVVPMKELLESNSFRDSSAALPLAIGLTAYHMVRVIDLADAPHILMAGATKQGKTACLQTMVASLLFSKRPEELKMVFIDPKGTEFRVYDKLINHYLAIRPDIAKDEEECSGAIVTKTTEADKVLDSLCEEMEERYEKLRMAKTTDIKKYNGTDMPYIVCFIDEFADLTVAIGGKDFKALTKRITNAIIRLASQGRAVGIHMVIATQRPSTDVISSLLKCNFPTRLAFRTSSRIDSMTILDCSGAEKLIGNGDLLLRQDADIERMQGGLISIDEMRTLVDFVGSQNSLNGPYYLPDPAPKHEDIPTIVDMKNLDERLEESARYVVLSQRASLSDLQRKLAIGYARAGRIMDQLEAAGIVGPQKGSKPRQVLVATLDGLYQMLDAYNAS